MNGCRKSIWRYIVEVIDRLDLSKLASRYSRSGSEAYHPALILALLVYGYAAGTFASRKIERATHDSVAFRLISLPIYIPIISDERSLTDLLRTGARALIEQAVEAELHALLDDDAKVTDLRGRQTVVRNGNLPEREIVTGVGPVTVSIPKVRGRSGGRIKFNSSLVPPYVPKAKRVEAALRWLYLRGVSTGDMQSALSVLLGDEAKGLSTAVIGRLKAHWAEAYGGIYRRNDTCTSGRTASIRPCAARMIGCACWSSSASTNGVKSACWLYRTTRTQNCVLRNTLLGLVFQLALTAEKRWHKILGFKRLPAVMERSRFQYGIVVITAPEITEETQQMAA